MSTIDPEVLSTFIEEAQERLVKVEAGLLKLETQMDNMDQELLSNVFREAHSLKATSNLLGFTAIERIAHSLENTLDQLRLGRLAPSEQMISNLLGQVDSMNLRVARLTN